MARSLLPETRLRSSSLNNTTTPFNSSPEFIAASRLIPRLQASILPYSLQSSSEAGIDTDSITPVPFHIKASPYHRTRLLHNVEHARTLLLRLEHSAQAIKIQSQKRDIQKRISDWRAIVRALKAEIEEWGRIYGDSAWYQDVEDTQKEDILAKYGRNKRRRSNEGLSVTDPTGEGFRDTAPETLVPEARRDDLSTSQRSLTPPLDSTLQAGPLRRRRGPHTPSPTSSSPTRAHTTGHEQDQHQPLLSTDATLAKDATTQLDLTSSMAELASQLRLSAQAFSNQLMIDTQLLDRAAEGLDKNVTGMESAGKRIGLLKRMSEGKGWWGRIMLYAWIVGLWIVMILVVGVGPKLRF